MAEALQAAQHQSGLVDQAAEILRLRAENAVYRADKEVDRAKIDSLEAALAAAQQRMAELERQLGLNSSNSGKPPSSDGQRKPPAQGRTQSTRGRSGKRSGGQPGHPGKTLQQTDNPDHVEKHVPPLCGGCGAPLSEADSVKYAKRQVFDLPPPPRVEVTEHQAHECRCGVCGHRTRAEFPDGVRGRTQYGPRLKAMAVYLQNWHMLPEDRLAELFKDLHGVPICAATLAGMMLFS